MIEAINLSKKIGRKEILSEISFSAAAGEFITLLGPNGAGKTTLLKILCLLTRPSAGELIVQGYSATKGDLTEMRRQMGVISHNTLIYDNLTAAENLHFYGRMYDVPDLSRRVDEILDEVGLTYCLQDPVRTFSRGMRQRLSIARGLINDPNILFLDEPYTGLDREAINVLNKLLAKIKAGKGTVFMVSHNYEQGLALSSRLLILKKGRIIHNQPEPKLSDAVFREVYSQQVGGYV